MTMKRSDLKELIRECLIEILEEGTGALVRTREQVVESKRSLPRRAARVVPPHISRTKKFDPALDTPIAPPGVIDEAVSVVAGGDDIMSSIFADTAATTLSEQAAGEDGAVGDAATRAMAKADPMEVFDASAAKWADLAFAAPAGPLAALKARQGIEEDD